MNRKPVIQSRRGVAEQKWKLIPANDEKIINSTDGTIIIHADPSVSGVASDELLLEIADNWAAAYRALINLHGGRKLYNRIIFDCTMVNMDPGIYAYVWGNADNHVYWGRNDFRSWLIKYKRRPNDWCFAALHEMGHLFDFQEPWDFETEALTDVYLVYVLEMYNGRATPDLSAELTYDARGIQQLYSSHGLKSGKTYDIWYVSHMLLQIKDAVGWGPFIDTFWAMDANKTQVSLRRAPLQMFDAFIENLSIYARTDVTQFLDPTEYQTLRTLLRNR